MCASVWPIEAIGREVYLSPAFVQGKDPCHTVVRRRRIDGVGSVEASIEVKGGVVRSVSLSGDFFAKGDVEAMMGCLCGVRLCREAVSAALPERTDEVIMNLGRDDLVGLIAED